MTIIGRLLLDGFYAEQLESTKMAATFEHCDKNISKLLNDIDSKNTKKLRREVTWI